MLVVWSMVVLTMCFPGILGATYCDYVLSKDCSAGPHYAPVCGTNGVTYNNNCYFAKGHCIDTRLNKLHDGSCYAHSIATTTTTPKPTTTLSAILLDSFCHDILLVPCGSDGPRVCGSDGKYYTNMCEFFKVKCFRKDLVSNGINCV